MLEILLGFLFGFLSFFSPCVLPLIPGYFCYITGLSLQDLKESKMPIYMHSIFFIFGFSLIFVLLGASATTLGSFLKANKEILRKIAGILIFFFGLSFLGILKLSFLQKEHRFHINKRPLGYPGTFLVGMAFGFGWTPCIGPFLGSALAMASTNEQILRGIVLLFSFSMGLGIPFFLSAIAIDLFFNYFAKIRKFFPYLLKVSGVILVIVGILFLVF